MDTDNVMAMFHSQLVHDLVFRASQCLLMRRHGYVPLSERA
jgi:hypothetical protein